MPKRYPSEFRRAVCKRLVAGEKVSSLRKELGVSEATLYLWKHQALIDADLANGLKSFEADELAQAYKTIAELGNGYVTFGPPKTDASHRVVAIPAGLTAMLELDRLLLDSDPPMQEVDPGLAKGPASSPKRIDP
jgi:hypothetical protein